MSTVIGSVTLDNDLVLVDEYAYNRISADVESTISGGIVLQEFSKLEKGRHITLESRDSLGWQQKSTVDALKALCDSTPYATHTLTITSGQTFTKTVRFRNEVDGGAVRAEPIAERPGYHETGVYYKVRVYLMVV